MLARERHWETVRRINEKGTLSTGELVEIFGVSVETIRRDLLELEKQGLLQRVHGGAVRMNEMRVCGNLSERIEENRIGKTQLCETAADLVGENDIIGIDSGSTAIHFAEALKRKRSRLTVVTHSLDVFQILTEKEGFQVILCGGCFMKEEKAFYGQIAQEGMSRLHVQKSFIFPSAISIHDGVSDFSDELQQMQRKLMEIGDKIYFLVNSDKFETHAFLKLCDMNTSHVYVTDKGLNEHYRQLYAENGMQVIWRE